MEERLRIELAHPFAAPESAYTRLTAGDVIACDKGLDCDGASPRPGGCVLST